MGVDIMGEIHTILLSISLGLRLKRKVTSISWSSLGMGLGLEFGLEKLNVILYQSSIGDVEPMEKLVPNDLLSLSPALIIHPV